MPEVEPKIKVEEKPETTRVDLPDIDSLLNQKSIEHDLGLDFDPFDDPGSMETYLEQAYDD